MLYYTIILTTNHRQKLQIFVKSYKESENAPKGARFFLAFLSKKAYD